MASASNMGLQELVDTLSRNIRDKIATDTGEWRPNVARASGRASATVLVT